MSEAERPLLTTKTWQYRALHASVRLGARTLYPARVRGVERIPDGGVLLASNHQSFLDIPLVAAAIQRHVCFVARDTLARSKFMAYIMHHCGAVLVKRGQGDRQALRDIQGHLEAGDLVAIFPEGTRSPDGRVRTFHKGALLAARMTGVPVLPVGIRGTFQCWPKGRKLPRFHRVSIEFAEPLEASTPPEELEAAVRGLVGDGRYAAPGS